MSKICTAKEKFSNLSVRRIIQLNYTCELNFRLVIEECSNQKTEYTPVRVNNSIVIPQNNTA